jgi:hypothetical protein
MQKLFLRADIEKGNKMDIIVKCSQCHSENLAVTYNRDAVGIPHFKCNDCGRGWKIDNKGDIFNAINNEDIISVPLEKDNWKHRSKNMSCEKCMYFVLKDPDNDKDLEELHTVAMMNSIGRCRRHAPTMSGWPVMFSADWCGDHKLDENKL